MSEITSTGDNYEVQLPSAYSQGGFVQVRTVALVQTLLPAANANACPEEPPCNDTDGEGNMHARAR